METWKGLKEKLTKKFKEYDALFLISFNQQEDLKKQKESLKSIETEITEKYQPCLEHCQNCPIFNSNLNSDLKKQLTERLADWLKVINN